MTYDQEVDAFAGRIIVALITSVALVTATIDPCAVTCHPQAGTTSADSPAAHCRAAARHAGTTVEPAASCHHDHDVASLDATPPSRVDAPTRIAVVAVARDLSRFAQIAPATGVDTGPFESLVIPLELSAFATPLRL